MMRIYELKAVEGNLAKIEFQTVLLTPVNDGMIRGKLIQKLTEGTVTLDMQRGFLVEKQIKVDRTVINPFGPGSSMHAVTKFTERALPNKIVAKNGTKTADPAAGVQK